MTLRELIMIVSTASYCHFTVRCMHRGLVYTDISCGDIPEEYKNMQVHSAVPTKCSCVVIKEWHICLNDCSIINDMKIQFKQFKDCKENDLVRYGCKLYYKIQVTYYIDSQEKAGMYNAVNAETGEIGWIDGVKKVEAISQ